MPHEQAQERAQERAQSSSFNVRFLTVDGKPLTVVGSADAIASLEKRLAEALSSGPESPTHQTQ
jgi:hypothetical protein